MKRNKVMLVTWIRKTQSENRRQRCRCYHMLPSRSYSYNHQTKQNMLRIKVVRKRRRNHSPILNIHAYCRIFVIFVKEETEWCCETRKHDTNSLCRWKSGREDGRFKNKSRHHHVTYMSFSSLIKPLPYRFTTRPQVTTAIIPDVVKSSSQNQ